jgi:Fe-S cluster biogenesis protein NfuA
MDLRSRVEHALRDEVAPALALDGSRIEVVEVADGIASVRLAGVCGGCPATVWTLLGAIEAELKARVPEVELVEAVG